MQKNRLGWIVLTVMLLTCVGFGEEKGGGVSRCFRQQGTWAETMVETRMAFRAWLKQQADRGEVVWGRWYQAGPIPSGQFFQQHFPIENINVRERDKDNRTIWKRVNYPDGVVHGLKPGINGSTYLYRNITVSHPQQLKAYLGSDDGLAVWLNGKEILSKNVPRGVRPNQDEVILDLRPGVNELMLKIYNISGGHGFYFATRLTPAADLWQLLTKAYPQETRWMRDDLGTSTCLAWLKRTDTELEEKLVKLALSRIGGGAGDLDENYQVLLKQKTAGHDPAWLNLYAKACTFREQLKVLKHLDLQALRLALEDMEQSSKDQRFTDYLEQLQAYKLQWTRLRHRIEQGGKLSGKQLEKLYREMSIFQREALLANPLLNNDQILVLRRQLGPNARKAMGREMGLPTLNSHNNTSIANPVKGWSNDIVVLSDLRKDVRTDIVYRPDKGKLISDMDLHYDADKMMFSMPGTHDRWQVFEMGMDGKRLRQITPTDLPDIDHFDSVYLPNENIIFTCTANYQGLPCEGGSRPMAPLYLMDNQGQGIRQLTFEQDSDWCPTVLNNGRVMYLRWEYSDLSHYYSRILFHMNPDGTEQLEYYGSGSYFPNAFFYARPLPDHPTAVVGIVGGHHGLSRSGRLMIIDPAQGRMEADGVVTEIPHRGRPVQPEIKDALVNGVWPQFLHPYPLSDKYFLVTAKLNSDSLWGIYLVDVFNNMTLIAEQEGTALLEPMPLQARMRPPVVPEKVDLTRKDATVFLTDIYQGDGLKGIPRGTVKRLRLFSYHYAHNKTGGHSSVGVESSWDVKRILGTVPVAEDGSAMFTIPANTTISLQPLDEEGRALQIMRSWFVGMPGEVVSCVGCHEAQNTTAPSLAPQAAYKAPTKLEPWQGPARPFSFKLEVEPLLDRHCVACHDGGKEGRPNFADKRAAGNFNEAYMALHPYTRRPGPESDLRMFKPMEYHARTSELIQMLETGHYGVKLSPEEWEVLYTWIDLNVPFRGKWSPREWCDQDQQKRRVELAIRYTGVDVDAEQEYDDWAEVIAKRYPIEAIKPKKVKKPKVVTPKVDGWPFNKQVARQKQKGLGKTKRSLQLGGGQRLELVHIPAGSFVMGQTKAAWNELSPVAKTIDKSFWMGRLEITNAQYALFDPSHDSRYIDQQWKDHVLPGYPANEPDQPVIRISWQEAMDFCEWLSNKTGMKVTLPTEAQWEWACRAGTTTPFYYGDLDTDFSPYANLADESIQLFAVHGVNPRPVLNPNRFYDFIPRDMRFNDGRMISGSVGEYSANAWGLQDMHGNVSEWTRSVYSENPDDDRRVIRGGSWRDRPKRATSSSRWGYESYQKVFNVGFRVVVEEK